MKLENAYINCIRFYPNILSTGLFYLQNYSAYPTTSQRIHIVAFYYILIWIISNVMLNGIFHWWIIINYLNKILHITYDIQWNAHNFRPITMLITICEHIRCLVVENIENCECNNLWVIAYLENGVCYVLSGSKSRVNFKRSNFDSKFLRYAVR